MTQTSVVTLGERIRTRRESRALTQRDVANALQVSAQAVSKWERGENAPDISALVTLSRLLGVSTDWLLGAYTEPREIFEATVLVADIVDSTRRTRAMGLRDGVTWINGRLFQLTEAVLQYDAVPVAYIGDMFVCFFAGAERQTRALRAASAARAMVSDPVGIGVSDGEVYLCAVGHPDYARRDLMGEAVAHAARAADWAKLHTKSLIAATAEVAASSTGGVRLGEGIPYEQHSLVLHEVLVPAA